MATGPRPDLDEAMRAGKVDLLTMHSGDITTDLVADGFGINMRPWTRNELCIVGPPDDPAAHPRHDQRRRRAAQNRRGQCEVR